MTQTNFQTIQKNVANNGQTRKPLTGYYVSTSSAGHNAATTEIVRAPARSA